MRCIAKRRVHLRLGAEPPIDLGRDKRQMLRRHLDARHVLVRRKQLHLCRGRHMQHMHAFAGCRGEPDEASRSRRAPPQASRHSRWLEGSPSRLSDARSRRRASSSAWKAARRVDEREDARQRLLVVDEQVAGGGAHEHFDAGSAWKLLELGSSSTFSRVAPTKKAKSQIHAVARARRPCRRAPPRSMVGGLVFGISNTAVTPPSTADAAAGFEVFLVLEPRLAEMHLGVDDARQDMQAGGVDGPRRRLGGEAANRDDRPSLTPISATPFAGMVDEGRALDEEIEGFCQDAALASACRLPPA